MKLGAERKKVAILIGLVLVAGYFILTGIFSSPSAGRSNPAPAKVSASAPVAPALEFEGPAPRTEARQTASDSLQDFRPTLKGKKGGPQRDLSSIDPTLRLDLLAKLEDVKLQGGSRSLFEFSAAPLPNKPEPKVIPAPKVQTVPLPPSPPPQATEHKPPPPPIPLKFFGYTTPFRQSNRRAFFMDGDQILVASEGEILKKRYRVVRIGVNSVVMEDLEHKAEQTLPLEPQAG